MNIAPFPTINGQNYGFTDSEYIGYGEEGWCVFLAMTDDSTDINLWVALEPDEMDSTDHNPFRHYSISVAGAALNASAPVDNVVFAAEFLASVASTMCGLNENIAAVDLFAVRTLKMVRIV